jgi:hypothetical protein
MRIAPREERVGGYGKSGARLQVGEGSCSSSLDGAGLSTRAARRQSFRRSLGQQAFAKGGATRSRCAGHLESRDLSSLSTAAGG